MLNLARSVAPSRGLDQPFLVGRVRLLHEHAGFGIIGSLICALVFGAACAGHGAPTELSIWTAGFAGLSAARLWQIRRFLHCEDKSPEAARRWGAQFLVFSLASGLWWGYAGIVLVEGQPEVLRLFTYLIIGGLCAGSVAAFAAVLPVFFAFTAGALGPLVIQLVLFGGDRVSYLVGFLILVFLLVLSATAVKQSETIRASLQIQFENQELIEGLQSAMDDSAALNDSLTAEIRQRERIEQDLARSLALYQATMDAVDEGILALDRDHRIVAINKRFKALWALNDKDAATGADHRRTAERLRRLQRPSPVPRADEATGTSLVELNDGRIFERQVVDYRLDGAAIGQVQTIRDVTGRIAADRELLRAKEMAEAGSRAKSEFLAHISHELRTPLNAIIGFSEIYLRQLFGDMGNPRYLDYAKDIHESATLLLSLINDILDLSKIEAGRAELFDEAVTLRKTARQCFRLVRSRAAEAELALEFTVPAELPVLRADERAIKQMLVNLLTNAIKFTPAGGRVRLEAAVDGDGALIVEIVDTGIGMSAEQIARALEPFGRVDSAFHRSREGTGLGLPLVKSLIEAQGGRLEIDSEPDKGTTTRLIFPPERVGGEAPGTDSE